MDKLAKLLQMLHNHEDDHTFDATSKECKACKDYNICARFHQILASIENSDLSEEIKISCTAALVFFKREYGWSTESSEELIDKNYHRAPINVINQRFSSLIDDFKHWHVLPNVLSVEDCEFLIAVANSVLVKCNNVICDIKTKNVEEFNKIKDLLKAKTEVKSEPDYNKMTKAELIELLKNK